MLKIVEAVDSKPLWESEWNEADDKFYKVRNTLNDIFSNNEENGGSNLAIIREDPLAKRYRPSLKHTLTRLEQLYKLKSSVRKYEYFYVLSGLISELTIIKNHYSYATLEDKERMRNEYREICDMVAKVKVACKRVPPSKETEYLPQLFRMCFDGMKMVQAKM